MRTIDSWQKEVDDWANQFEKPYFSPLSLLAALVEEVGETAKVMNTLYGDKKKKDTDNIKNLEEELGDILFSLTCIANSHNFNLDEILDNKMNKVYGRDNNRFQRKTD
ncbi:MAG: nucleotide pyrophosphohydrolase [Bacilli bacterium]|nr:nucleotide pyrophosphohydrolase [Bacilli bacterium]